MISLTSAQLDAWIAAYFFPLARILALLAAAPPFSNAALPRRVRLILGLAITLALAPALPPIPPVPPGSGAGLAILAQQMLIGFAMGYAMRLVVAAIDFAGEVIGLQMGLGFATFYDPDSASQTPVLAEFIAMLGILVLLSINGHLMILATLAQSFVALPIGATTLAAATWSNLAHAGAVVFASGLMLALPAVAALLIVNIALGVLTRAAPQLNLFAVGFPITLIGGFVMLILSLGYLAAPLTQLFEHGLQAMLGHFVPAR
ncbi:flagellar biosynthetic protein FliR [Azospira restricta]|uniref:Flagellar biosynthetic protein FliR n=1 Tax=Azospira restricta TaxID=404405 RepID=A0A974SSA5_9RHOO|nr:flagellar biosynthetic protein FliR [Azospira restricta]QRJ65462.1 flagellar biosynthetic protein FliR [Azospira restricta]